MQIATLRAVFVIQSTHFSVLSTESTFFQFQPITNKIEHFPFKQCSAKRKNSTKTSISWEKIIRIPSPSIPSLKTYGNRRIFYYSGVSVNRDTDFFCENRFLSDFNIENIKFYIFRWTNWTLGNFRNKKMVKKVNQKIFFSKNIYFFVMTS